MYQDNSFAATLRVRRRLAEHRCHESTATTPTPTEHEIHCYGRVLRRLVCKADKVPARDVATVDVFGQDGEPVTVNVHAAGSDLKQCLRAVLGELLFCEPSETMLQRVPDIDKAHQLDPSRECRQVDLEVSKPCSLAAVPAAETVWFQIGTSHQEPIDGERLRNSDEVDEGIRLLVLLA